MYWGGGGLNICEYMWRSAGCWAAGWKFFWPAEWLNFSPAIKSGKLTLTLNTLTSLQNISFFFTAREPRDPRAFFGPQSVLPLVGPTLLSSFIPPLRLFYSPQPSPSEAPTTLHPHLTRVNTRSPLLDALGVRSTYSYSEYSACSSRWWWWGGGCQSRRNAAAQSRRCGWSLSSLRQSLVGSGRLVWSGFKH